MHTICFPFRQFDRFYFLVHSGLLNNEFIGVSVTTAVNVVTGSNWHGIRDLTFHFAFGTKLSSMLTAPVFLFETSLSGPASVHSNSYV